MVTVSAEAAERARAQFERARARRARYELKTGRKRHDDNETRCGGHQREIHFRDYTFIGWDGEAPEDTGYSLFGSSEGDELCHPRLETEECFKLLLDTKQEHPHSIFVWFGGRYDWDEILRQSIPLYRLARLKSHGVIRWRDYRITECEGKIYSIARDGIRVVLFEISGWFHKAYIGALRDYGIGTDRCGHGSRHCAPVRVVDSGGDGGDSIRSVESVCDCACDLCRIEAEKERRGEFRWQDIGRIREYMRLELKYMPPLMERIREICLSAGFDPRAWYGPSALAKQALTRNKIRQYMAKCPDAVNDAACHAFAGGRFEMFRGGIVGEHWTFDQNSAYMHAALDLPDLAHGTWRRGRKFEPGKFAVYRIRYCLKSRPGDDVILPNPLWRRLENGNVIWPRRCEGWYWSPEAELVADDAAATFLDAWIFDESTSARPFAFVHEMFRKRLVFQNLPPGNPSREAEKALKWALAAIYGQLARAVGWDRKHNLPPSTHQIEWAGYILSKCRATMYRVAKQCGDKLLSIDTDSVTAMCRVTVELGSALGQWKEEHHTDGIYFQNGVYFTRDGGEWSKGKARGMERRQGNLPITPEILTEAITTGQSVRMVPKRRYVTVKMALNGRFDDIGTWPEHAGNVLVFGGGGKRYHNAKLCKSKCPGSGLHVFMPKVPLDNPFDIMSYPHRLPWKHGPKPEHWETDGDVLWLNTERLDKYEQWECELTSGRQSAPVESADIAAVV